MLVVRCSTRSVSCSAICESVCCAVVCGARASNFLCAANDAIYESPYSAKCRAERAVRAVQGLQLSALAALAKPSSSLQGCLPPLPEEALDRPREYWVRAAFRAGAGLSHTCEGRIWGSIQAPRRSRAASAPRSASQRSRPIRSEAAQAHHRTARHLWHKYQCLTCSTSPAATTAGPRRVVFLGAASAAAAAPSSRRRSRAC